MSEIKVGIVQDFYHQVKVGMAQMEEALAGVPQYWDSLREVREENLRHSQLATAKENLR